MGLTNQAISITGTEIDLVKAFAASLTGADSRITCQTDIDAQFTDTSAKPTIIFDVNGVCQIQLQRSVSLSNTTNTYNLFVIYNGITSNTIVLNILGPAAAYNSVNTRTLKYFIAANDNTIYLCMGGYNDVLPAGARVKLTAVKTDIISMVSYNLNAYVCTDTTHKGTTGTLFTRLGYTAESEKVEIVKSKAFVAGTNSSSYQKIADITSLCDCSVMSANTLITVSGDKYYVMDSNTLIKL
jgi:hypothetical protein